MLYDLLKYSNTKNYDELFKFIYDKGMDVLLRSKSNSPDAMNFYSYCIQNGGINRAVKNVGSIINQCLKTLKSEDPKMLKSKESASYLLSQIASNVHNAADLVYDNFGSNVTTMLSKTIDSAKSP